MELHELVLSRAGATRPQRDKVDARVVRGVRNGGGAMVDSPEQVGGYPHLASSAPPADSDHDGMPDDWEAQIGLDPADPSDASLSAEAEGYTNIELYLHTLLPPEAARVGLSD